MGEQAGQMDIYAILKPLGSERFWLLYGSFFSLFFWVRFGDMTHIQRAHFDWVIGLFFLSLFSFLGLYDSFVNGKIGEGGHDGGIAIGLR